MWLNSIKSYDKTSMDEECLLMNEQEKQFLEMKTVPGEDAEKIVEITMKDLE